MARYDRVGEQIEDDAGNPLISGKIYFFESGTTTPKATYADVNLSILNAHPVILTAAGRVPSIFFTGTARVIITSADNVQIDNKDPIGGESEEGVFSPWNSLTIYNVPDIVVGSDGNFYISITNGNQDNDPTTDAINWTQFRLVRVWNPNETYSIGQLVVASDEFMYISITDNNLNNNPVSDTTNWKPGTTADVPTIILAAGKQFAYNNF